MVQSSYPLSKESQERLVVPLSEASRLRHEAMDVPVGVLEFTVEGTILYANATALRYTGYTADELVGQNKRILFRPTDVDTTAFYASVKAILAGDIQRQELLCVRKDSSEFWIDTCYKLTHSPEGRVDTIVAIALDISDRKRTEKDLHRSQTTLDALLENSLDAIVMYDPQGTILYDSPAVKRILGWSTAERIGKNMKEFTHPDDYPMRLELFTRALIERRSIRAEYRLLMKGGGWCWVESASVTELHAHGVHQVIVLTRDISNSKRTEEELLRKQQQLEEAQIVGRIGNWEYDAVTGNVLWSDQMYVMLGVPAVEIPTVQRHINLVHPEDRPKLARAMKQILEQGVTYDIETRHLLPGNTLRYYQVRGRAKRGKNGNVIAVYGTLADIHERKTRELALQAAEERLQEAQRTGKLGSWEYNLANGSIALSDNMYAMFGIRKDRPLPNFEEAIRSWIHPEDTVVVQDSFTQLLATGNVVESVVRCRSANDILRYYQARGVPVYDDRGNITGIRGTIIDIHNLKEQEHALEESERRFRSIIEYSNEIVYTLALDGTLTFASKAWQRILGHNVQEVVGKNFVEFVHPEDIPTALTAMASVLYNDEAIRSLEYRARHLDESWRWHSTSGSLVKDTDGTPLYFAGIAQDVTERKQYRLNLERAVEERTAQWEELNNQLQIQLYERQKIEADLRQNQLALSTLIETTDDAIWSVDNELQITAYNTTFANLLQHSYGVDAELGEDLLQLFRDSVMDRDEWSLWREWYARALHGEKFTVEYESRHRQGKTHSELAFNPIRNERKEVLGIVVFSSNIAKRKQAEEDIRRALQQEKELGALKSRFVAMVSHEFRTPLTTIRSSAELLRRSAHKMTPEKQIRYFDDIEKSIKAMTQLLEDVLFLGKAEAKKIPVTPWMVDVTRLCNEAAAEAELTVNNGIAPERSRVHIAIQPLARTPLLDERLVRHILLNIISNALKYSPTETHVDVAVQHSDTSITFSVTDKGIGISEEDQRQLFEPFHRGENVGTIPGTGLGMAMVKQALDLMRGFITCASTINGGTTLTVEIPCMFS